jgi:tRNA modification GTPase
LEIALTLFRGTAGGKDLEPYRVHFGEIRDPQTDSPVDEVLLTWFKAPRSYTAENVIEISGHGGTFVTSRILKLVLDQGARLAAPGEFSRRALLNGRMDLSQAEAVADVIAAESDKALHSALCHLKGKLSKRINTMYSRLLAVVAQLEATIDFSEEGLTFQKREDSIEEIREVAKEIKTLASTFHQGKIFREGARVALIGKPNVGKSSLLNALLQEDRAIVTAIPGTTRDTLEERVRIKDIHINIIDSAGLRENPDIIEEEGIQRAKTALDQADLALVMFDGAKALDVNDRHLIEEVRDKPILIVINKNDLPRKLNVDRLQADLKSAQIVDISATNHQGLDDLKEAIYHFVVRCETKQEAVFVTRERHRLHLVEADCSLVKAMETLEQGLSEEFAAVDVNIAMENLAAILGKNFAEDLIDQIFGDFCIGK